MHSVNEETLALMESLGHSREAGLKALNRFPNDPDRAFGWLMDQIITATSTEASNRRERPGGRLYERANGVDGCERWERWVLMDGEVWLLTNDTLLLTTGIQTVSLLPPITPRRQSSPSTPTDPIDLSAVNDSLTGLTEDDLLKMAMEASLRDCGSPAPLRPATTSIYGGMSGWSSGYGGPSPSQSTLHLPQRQCRPSVGRQYSDSPNETDKPEHKEFATTDGVDVGPAERARMEVEDPHSNNPFKASMKSNLGTFHKVDDSRVDDGTMGVVVADQSTSGLNVSFDDNLPAYHSPGRPPPSPTHKDDTDLERALALSMMDVSGGGVVATDPLDGMNDLEMKDAEVKGVETGAGLIPEGAEDRAEGAPMLYRTTDYAAGFIVCMFQCLFATPQMRLFLERLQLPNTESPSKADSALRFMQNLLRASTDYKAAYIDVDTSQLVDMDLCNYTMASPLSERLRATLDMLSTYCESIAGEAATRAQSSEADLLVDVSVPSESSADDLQYQRYLKQPASLLKTAVGPVHRNDNLWHGTMCPLEHDAAQDSHIMQCISRAVWAQEPNQMIYNIADIFSIGVKKAPRPFGEGVVGVMQLEEELYMDRFLMSNAAKSIETRGQENWRKGEMTRCEETLAELSTFKNRSIEQSLDAIITHYESGEAVKGEEEEKREKVSGEMVEILKRMKTSMAAKKEALQARIEVLKKEISEVWDIPELKKHRYLLRGVSYYVGFDSPTAYHTYVRQEDGKWWKMAQKGATETDFATIVKDATGLHYDQGPFYMTYSRDGPSPSQDTVLSITCESGPSQVQSGFEHDLSLPLLHQHSPELTVTQLSTSDSSTSSITPDVCSTDTPAIPTSGDSMTTPSDSEMTFNDDISAPSQIKDFDVTHLDSVLRNAR